jgi:hypothetical protein
LKSADAAPRTAAPQATGFDAGAMVPLPFLEVLNAVLAATNVAAAAEGVAVLPRVDAADGWPPAGPAIKVALPVQGGLNRRPVFAQGSLCPDCLGPRPWKETGTAGDLGFVNISHSLKMIAQGLYQPEVLTWWWLRRSCRYRRCIGLVRLGLFGSRGARSLDGAAAPGCVGGDRRRR